MTHFIKAGEVITISPGDAPPLEVFKTLPVATYALHLNNQGYFLAPVDDLRLPKKIYGDIPRYADRIMSTFDDRPSGTGVLLSGEKGSGKTMLAAMLTRHCAKLGMPTILIQHGFCGADFNELIQRIDQPCAVLFDEFEKVYDEDAQENLLSLFDGIFPSKKLFVLTCNDKYRINQHMKNRPGRLFYHISFSGLDVKFIQEYAEENLKDKTLVGQICKIATSFYTFNFDMLKAIIEEINRYGESPIDAIKLLNMSPNMNEDGENQPFAVKLFLNGKEADPKDFYPTTINGSPLLQESFCIHSKVGIKGMKPGVPHDMKEDDDGFDDVFENSKGERQDFYFNFSQRNLRSVSPEGLITYEAGSVKVVMKKHIPYEFSYEGLRGF